MKTIALRHTMKMAAIATVAIIATGNTAFAQHSKSAYFDNYKSYYANADWQFNAPLESKFTKRLSGWGANFDLGMYLTPNVGVGLFFSYSSNHKEVPAETFSIGDATTLTASQARSLYQVPFGVEFRYRIVPDNILDPYLSLRLGTEYARMTSYFATYDVYTSGWGFYMSPEIGTNIWFSDKQTVGLHVAVYYSLSTNKGHVLNGSIHNIDNIGFRVGLAF